MHISDCCQFSDIHISQGSVATYLRCGGIFKYEFVANLPVTPAVKQFWKSVNICGSYGQEFSVLFFWDTVYNDQSQISNVFARKRHVVWLSYRSIDWQQIVQHGRSLLSQIALLLCKTGKKVAHTRLPSVGFRSWSRFLAVSLQVMWIINRAVGCHYFLPGLQLSPQPLSGLLPVLLLGEHRHNGCEQFA